MNTNDIQSGMYSGIITARSVDDPSPADAITYTVVINALDALELENVTPQESARWSAFDDSLNLVPFEVGFVVGVHLIVMESEIQVYIADREFPESGACEGEG